MSCNRDHIAPDPDGTTNTGAEGMDHKGLTLRATLVGLLLGVLVNLTNTYYGLRVGAGGQMSMISGMLGYVGFRVFSKYLTRRLDPTENVLIISVATATGCMPLTAGFVGIIPALEYLIGPNENGPLRIAFGNLVSWSIGLCFFGISFAFLLRKHLIERQDLPWPGPRATSQLVKTLHHRSSTQGYPVPTRAERRPLLREALSPVVEWEAALSTLLGATITSGIFSILMYFIPILHSLPIFGNPVSKDWLWNVDLSPGFLGQGMIIGPAIASHMLLGSIVGWAILSPYAKHQGWAPGPVDDWSTGSRGWIIWVSLASLFADASVKLLWFVVQPIWNRYSTTAPLLNTEDTQHRGSLVSPSMHARYVALPNEVDDDQSSSDEEFIVPQNPFPSTMEAVSPSPGSGLSRKMFVGFLLSVAICTLVVHAVFGEYIPWYYTLIGVGLSLPMAVIGIRSIAETDYNPESALVSQLAFAGLVSHSNPDAVIMNLISAAIAQAGANQSGDLAYDLKVGDIVGAQPQAQAAGQVIGSLFGAIVSCAIYRLYAGHYPIPGPLFRIPSSYLVLSTARLVLGRGLPEGVGYFGLVTAILSTISTIVKMRYAQKWWEKLIPSGVAFAMGIYLMPSFVITRFIGGLLVSVISRRHIANEGNTTVFASGLILGESIASLVSVGLTALQVPQVGGN